MASKTSAATLLATYAAWIGLTVLAAVVALQLNVVILYLASAVIENPSLRPAGWNSGSLVNIQRLAVLILGSLWLMVILWMENQLRSAARSRTLLRQTLWLAGTMLAIFALCSALLWTAA